MLPRITAGAHTSLLTPSVPAVHSTRSTPTRTHLPPCTRVHPHACSRSLPAPCPEHSRPPHSHTHTHGRVCLLTPSPPPSLQQAPELLFAASACRRVCQAVSMATHLGSDRSSRVQGRRPPWRGRDSRSLHPRAPKQARADAPTRGDTPTLDQACTRGGASGTCSGLHAPGHRLLSHSANRVYRLQSCLRSKPGSPELMVVS